MAGATTGGRGGRPMVMGTRGVVTSGHYLATEAGMSILRRGGNAFDAAAAVGFALTVTQPHQNGIGGEVPMVVYSAKDGKVHAVSGHGIAPKAATIERFRSLGINIIPGDGFLPALVPPAPASWILLLQRFGTMRLADVLQPAIEICEHGVPMYDALRNAIAGAEKRFREEWPTSAEVFLPGGKVPEIGDVWRQPLWARTFKKLLSAERGKKGRAAGLRAAYDEFYRGAIAKTMVKFVRNAVRDASGQAHEGMLTLEDFDAYEPRIEEPASATYRGIGVHKCGPWTQGPVLLQSLLLCERFDLAKMGHNSAEYISTVVECMKLAYADREFHYGDPLFLKAPIKRLLSKEYAAERAKLVNAEVASPHLHAGGYLPISATSVLEVSAVFATLGVGAGAGEAGAGGYDEAGGHRLGRQHGERDAVGRVADVVAGGGGLGISAGDEGADVQPGGGAPERAGAGEAAADDAYAVAGDEAGEAVDGFRVAGRRRAGPVGARVFPERGGVRDAATGGGRGADVLVAALAVVVLSAQGGADGAQRRGKDTGGGEGGAGEARARHTRAAGLVGGEYAGGDD